MPRIGLFITLVGAVLVCINLPRTAPSWAPAVAAIIASLPVPVRTRSRPLSYAIPVLSALAAALGPLVLVLPGPWKQCVDAEYIGVVIASVGLALHAVSTARPRRAKSRAEVATNPMSSVRNVF